MKRLRRQENVCWFALKTKFSLKYFCPALSMEIYPSSSLKGKKLKKAQTETERERECGKKLFDHVRSFLYLDGCGLFIT